MAEWVEKGSIKGPPGEIPDVSDFLRDGDVSSAISGSAEKVASDKAVKDYVDAQVSAEATSRQEQDSSLQTQIGGKANVEHSHEMDDVTGLNDKISEIETNVSGKANATHTHTTAQVDGLDTKLSGIDDDIAAKADKVHKHAIADVTDLQTTLDGKAASKHTHETSDITGLDSKISEIEGNVADKADSAHTHDAADIVSGTLVVDRIPSIPDSKIENVSATKLTGTVPQANLPSYVDDVIEAENYASLPPTGEAGKIYVDKETNKTYRWGGSAYVEISASLALGETSATAFRGDYGKVAYDHAQAKGSEFAAGLYKITTNAEGHVTSATAVAKSDITALGIPSEDTDTTYTAGAGLGLSGTEFSIADSGVTTAKLANDSVTADKIADGVIPDVSEFITSEEASGAYAAKSHTHDDRYYTETEVDGLLDGKANVSHTHTIENVTGLQDALDEKADVGSVTLTSLGVTATAEELNYMDGVTSNVQTQLAGKADSAHTHANATTSTAGFMSAEDKTKLEGVETGANKYVHPASAAGAKASGLYKITTDANGHVTGATAVEKDDITSLGIPAQDTDTTYTAGSGLTLSGTEFSIASKGVTADKIADGVIPESVSYDVATSEADGLMSSEDKTALDNLKTNAVTTDASGYVQKSPFKFKNSDSSVEMNFTSKTETSLDLEFRTTTGTDVVTISADNLFGEASGGIAMGTGATFDMGEKSVNGIVDAVGEGADGTKLVTDKAVKDAIAAIDIPDPLPEGGTDGQVLTKTADGEAWEDIPDYENATTEYDGLMSSDDKKKLDSIAEGADKLPDGGTTGQVLTKTSGGEAWADVPQPDISGVPRLDSGKMKSLHKLGITDLNNVTEPGTYVGASGFGGYPTVENLPDEFMTIASGAVPVFYVDVYRFDTPDDMGMSANYLIQKLYPMYENGVGRAYIRRGSISSGAQWGDWFGIGVPQVAGNSEAGYVLQVKDSYGNIEWGQAPQPDLTGVVKISNNYLEHEDQRIAQIHVSNVSDADTIIGSVAPGSSTITAMGQSSAQVVASNGNDIAALLVTTAGASLKIGSKSVTSITDDASTGDTNALATAKAVKSYVDSKDIPHASDTQYGVVKCASDEDFKAYMNIS